MKVLPEAQEIGIFFFAIPGAHERESCHLDIGFLRFGLSIKCFY